ncbi:unnamed protein product [Withania somnifera]
MASKLLKPHTQSIQIPHPLFQLSKLPYTSSLYSFGATQQRNHLYLSVFFIRPKSQFSPLQCLLSSPTPPTTKEDAISEAKLKKLKQPRFHVELPVVDESSSALSQLAVGIFGGMPIKRKGPKIKVLLLWPKQSLTQAAETAFENKPSSPIIERMVSSGDVIVFMVPEASRLRVMKAIADILYPKPVVIFNPKWGFDEENSFGELSGFVDSFEVVYSFMGLEVRGILSNRKGVMFKCVKDGVLSGEKWYVFVEEDGELKVVSRFKTSLSILEVEKVL